MEETGNTTKMRGWMFHTAAGAGWHPVPRVHGGGGGRGHDRLPAISADRPVRLFRLASIRSKTE